MLLCNNALISTGLANRSYQKTDDEELTCTIVPKWKWHCVQNHNLRCVYPGVSRSTIPTPFAAVQDLRNINNIFGWSVVVRFNVEIIKLVSVCWGLSKLSFCGKRKTWCACAEYGSKYTERVIYQFRLKNQYNEISMHCWDICHKQTSICCIEISFQN